MVMPVPQVGKVNDAQNYGAALTYARRYALTAMLGIVADEDTDAAPRQAPRQAAQWDDIPSAATKTNGNGSRGLSDDQVKPTDKQMKALYAMGKSLYGDEWDAKRAELVNHVTNGRSESSKHLTRKETSTLLDGMKKKLDAQES